MKKLLLFFVLLPALGFAQPGYLFKVLGGGSVDYGSPRPAYTGGMGVSADMLPDNDGNLYVTDYDYARILKIDRGGMVSVFAGGGSSLADGIRATSARLYLNAGGPMASDKYGNIYFAESNRIRKINPNTGIITTIAGSTAWALSGDGGPASAATFHFPHGLCIDVSGNIFIADELNHRIRKIDVAGIITTYAGSVEGYGGDGGPATNAKLQNPDGICTDSSGNLYIADKYNHRVRKVSTDGIITTIAGTGVAGFAGDSGLAVLAKLNTPSTVCFDKERNLCIADYQNGRVRKINWIGNINTIVGGGKFFMSDGVGPTYPTYSRIWGVAANKYGDLYFSTHTGASIHKIAGNGATATFIRDSFSVCLDSMCYGPRISIYPVTYSRELSVKSWYGDGAPVIDTFSAYNGYACLNHEYFYPGVYTVKHVLYLGAVAIDSIVYSYKNKNCDIIPIRLFFDENSNCTFDEGLDWVSSLPTTLEIDSNGIPIDTMTVTSGTDFRVKGNPGCEYTFRILSSVPGISAYCPTTGVIHSTLLPVPNHTNYIGFHPSGTAGFDLTMHSTVRSGSHLQQGELIIANKYALPQATTVSVTHSPKYRYQSSMPSPSSVAGNTITWDLGRLSSTDISSKQINYTLFTPSVRLSPGDTVQSYCITLPSTGDINPDDNNCDRNDTVKSSFDPNHIEVSPGGVIPVGTLLTYSTEFENTGNDTAQNIYVLDTLPNSLDIHTLQMVASTHPVVMSKFWNGSNWVLKFDFANIKLLDSSHHNECTGMYVYKIKAKTTLAPGTLIPNRAGIYFDDNEVVMTNTAISEIETLPLTTASWAANKVTVFPNPANNTLTVDNADNHSEYRIVDLLGKTAIQGELTEGRNTLALGQLAQGMYLIEIKDATGNKTVLKIVKE